MSKQLEPHVQRVVDEKKELDDKIAKLKKFLGSNEIGVIEISVVQLNLLKAQLKFMEGYTEVLEMRLDDFEEQS